MGCRLHWAKVHKVEWTGGYFNWNAEVFKRCLNHLDIQMWEATNQEDDYGDFEIPIEDWKKLKKILKDSRGTDEYDSPIIIEEDYGHLDGTLLTYHHLDDWAKEVSQSYDKDNDYIRFSWF